MFHTVKKVFGAGVTNQESALEETMMTYWINFVHSGNPNTHYVKSYDQLLTQSCNQAPSCCEQHCELPSWPEYHTPSKSNDEKSTSMMVFNTQKSSNLVVSL